MNDGAAFVLSGPSAVGKSTLIARLLADPRRRLAVSATTRTPRNGEVDGVHYKFVDDARFAAMLDAGQFLEWAEVHGKRYGTPRSEVDPFVAAGRFVLLDVDFNGFRAVRTARPGTPGIFIEPPSFEELERRLRSRSTEDEATLLRRLEHARWEMGTASEYDHVVVNDDISRALAEVEAILESGRSRR